MCGIAGFYNAEVDENLIQHGLAQLKHRGPDAQGFYHTNRNGLLHTRLSIIELSPLGAQPYYYEDLVLVYNGEIYNYEEVRTLLVGQGYSFQSNSDTEVLIKAFHCWREKCVDHFIGMFAFGILNTTEQKLWLFRDRLGVKPLYFYSDSRRLFFASELKALRAFDIPQEIDMEAVASYFRFGFVGGHQSILKGIQKLEAGHFLTIDSSGVKLSKYWDSHNQSGADDGRSENDWIDELEALMKDAFRYRLVADVPIGVFLSGGIDSSLLTAILQKQRGDIHTFTIGFEEQEFDESVYANQVSSLLKTQHSQKILKLEEARDLLFKFYDVYDEPFADTSGIPTSCVTKVAKEEGMNVVLSADGGDELFGGYSHYQNAFALYKKMAIVPGVMKKGMRAAIRSVLTPDFRAGITAKNITHKAYAFEELLLADNPRSFFEAYLANQSSDEIRRMVKSPLNLLSLNAKQSTHPLQQMMDWDLHHYLPDDLLVKVDRATMYHGLECREPFLDHRLVEFSARLPLSLKIRNGQGKYILRRLLRRYLPEAIFERRKQGFSIPIFSWFSKDIDQLFDHYLSPNELAKIPFLDADEITREQKKYKIFKQQGKQYNIEKMWRILSFAMWWEKHGSAA